MTPRPPNRRMSHFVGDYTRSHVIQGEDDHTTF